MRFTLVTRYLLFLLGTAPLLGQVVLEGCGAYERDGLPGHTTADLHDSVRYWNHAGDEAHLPDYDGDRRVTVLDLTRHQSCVALGPGLIGRYYGYQDGVEQPHIELANTDIPDADPVVVRATPDLNFFQNHHHSSQPLMESQMHLQFRGTFTGFLQVPQSGEYTLGLRGGDGMRLTLDGETHIEYSESPHTGEVTLALNEGFYPIQIDYVNRSFRGPIISFYWRAAGTVIGPNNRSVSPSYLWHRHTEAPVHAKDNLDVVFSVENFSRVTSRDLDLTARLYAPETTFAFTLNGRTRSVVDGVVSERLRLQPGLNKLDWSVTTGNRGKNSTLTLYYDAGQAGTPGLAMMTYPTSVADTYTVNESHVPMAVHIINGTNLAAGPNGYPDLPGDTIGTNTTVMLRGRIRVEEAGTYRFVGGGQWPCNAWVNGRLVVARYQGGENDSIHLEPGYHHFVFTAHHDNPRAFPNNSIRWQPPGAQAQDIPAERLSHLPDDIVPAADFSTNQGHSTRVGGDLIAEYLFTEADPFGDSGRYNLDLPTDPRWIVRDGGSVTANGPSFLQSTTLGSHILNTIKKSRAFTIEQDWYHRRTYNNTQQFFRINININITNDLVLRGFTQGNRFNFIIRGVDRIQVPVDLVDGERIHCAITYDGSHLRIYMNGALAVERAEAIPDLNPTLWSGQKLRFGDHRGIPFAGTLNTLAFYGRALSQSEVNQNKNANRALRTSSARLPFNEHFEIVPPGTGDAELAQAVHVLNRLTMGPSPEHLRQILDMGVRNWIEHQLQPQHIEENPAVRHLETVYQPTRGPNSLRSWLMAQMIHSERQLQEVMAWFWENHFSTDLGKTGSPQEEFLENQRFRELALGDFVALLKASALNYPMTEYLDSVTNVAGNPNENYAREIFELHAYGEDNGYGYEDIVEAARIFTGWTEWNRNFSFNPGRHDYGPKQLQGLDFSGGQGIEEGLILIETIATSENTAEFISYKLCQWFVADDPPADVQAAARDAFLANNGNITAVLRAILFHDRFLNDPNTRNNKVKTPLEFITGMIRATGTQENLFQYQHTMDLLDMPLFHHLEPTGFAERAETWMNTNSVFYRWQLINGFSGNRVTFGGPSADVALMRSRYGLNTTDDVLHFFDLMFAGGAPDPAFRRKAAAWLTQDQMTNLDLSDPANRTVLENRLPQTLNYYMRLPRFNLQ
ncbi:DUF1800 family protein [Acanthopleuribacter pedis]|uniref:DUF1800 family protein n=1 Tax=Acanthopleuribacter pedis TaxID=442870 RepID=A0A8J7U4L4_9BACT|nr:DUF1800 family protein [Acanthopleuribacter pedis]MBO1320762.1 DUF1800 family protein [Acanthopleuribacter pedis]